MCKILTITGIPTDAKSQKTLNKIMSAAAKHMPENDPHGWGYMASGHAGIFTEKWLNPKQALLQRGAFPESCSEYVKTLGDAVTPELGYMSTGSPEPIETIGMHSRFATCDIGLANVHPFTVIDTALIHNGIVAKQAHLRLVNSTCDSEQILHAYIDGDVAIDPESIQLVTDSLSGSFACAVLTKDRAGEPVLDIFRNTGSELVTGWIEDLKTPVFCTTRHLLTKIMHAAKVRWTYVGPLDSGVLVRFNARTGKIITKAEFTSKHLSHYDWWKDSEYSFDPRTPDPVNSHITTDALSEDAAEIQAALQAEQAEHAERVELTERDTWERDVKAALYTEISDAESDETYRYNREQRAAEYRSQGSQRYAGYKGKK